MVWRGWANRTELPRFLAEVLVEGGEEAERDIEIEEIRTVKDLLEVWLGEVVMPRTDLKARSKKNSEDSARRIVGGLGVHRVERLSRLAIDKWVASRQRRGHGSTTIRLDLVTLKAAWTWGRQVGACPRDDFTFPKVRPVPKHPKTTPSRRDVERVIQWLDLNCKPWVALVVRLQAALGCRIGELGELTWARVDLDAGTAVLEGKTGRRVVPLVGSVVEVLEAAPRTSAYVSGRSPRTVRSKVNELLGVACQAIGIEAFTSHGLRRLAVDTLARSGVDAGSAAAMLGHSPATMLQAYRRVSHEDLVGAARALSRNRARGTVVAFPGGHNERSQNDDDSV
ncbi:MAG: site-specific integrase [Myxococcota bacterium]